MLIKHETPHGSWVRSSAFIMASVGAVIGFANFWRLPYVMAEHGGFWFLLTYFAFLVLFALPVLYAEMLLGRLGRCSPVGSMKLVVRDYGSRHSWSWAGVLGTATGLLTLALYVLVAGMTLAYVFRAATGAFNGAMPTAVNESLMNLRTGPGQLLAWELIFLAGVLIILIRGVNKGIERAVRLLVPLLFVILVVLLVYAWRQGDMDSAFVYLFVDGRSAFSWRSVMWAAQNAFFTLSIGMGAMMAYGAYSPGRRGLVRGISWIVGLDLLVSVLAGFVIFPLIFAAGLGPSQGFDLLFRQLPMAFGQLPAGQFLGAVFFLLMTLTAWGSAIALGEPVVAWLVERFRIARFWASLLLFGVSGALAFLLTLSFGVYSDWNLSGLPLFSLYDWLVSGLLIPVTALLITLYVGWVLPEPVLRERVTSMEFPGFYPVWRFLLRFLAPGLLALLMVFGALNMLLSTCERDEQSAGGFCAWSERAVAEQNVEAAGSGEIRPIFHNEHNEQISEEINDQDH